MRSIDWNSVFDEVTTEPGASSDDLDRFVKTVFSPMSEREIAEVNGEQTNPFPCGHPLYSGWRPFDSANWVFPSRSLPPSYLSLLAWSNGGNFVSGERELGVFPALDPRVGVRDMMLAYHVPQYMPLALPFAFNGGGVFYMFDMRSDSVEGEYPIVCAEAGNLGWDDGWSIANTLEEACRGKCDVWDLRR